MGDSYAVQIYHDHAVFAKGGTPATDQWKKEVPTTPGQLPESKNKFWTCLACKVYDGIKRGNDKAIHEVCDYIDSIAHYHFMEGEANVSEEAYYAAITSGKITCRGGALRVGRTATASWLEKELQSHVAWLAAQASTWRRKSVKNHQINDSNGVILVGNGNPISGLRGIAMASVRGATRQKDTDEFLFTDRVGLSACLYQAIWDVSTSSERSEYNAKKGWYKDQHDIWSGAIANFSGVHPWGMNQQLNSIVREFLDNPSISIASKLLPFMKPFNDYRQVARHTDGSIYSVLFKDHNATFDPWMIDAIVPNGDAYLVTCEDGFNSKNSRQEVREEATRYKVFFIGDENGPRTLSLQKTAAPVLFTFRNEPSRVILNGQDVPPTNPPNPPTNPPVPGKHAIEYIGVWEGEEVYGTKRAGVKLVSVHPEGPWAARWITDGIS